MAAGFGAEAEVAVVLTVWVPELPLVTLPEGTVSVKVLRSPTIEPAATAPPAMAEARPMEAVLVPAFLVMLETAYALPPMTTVLPTAMPFSVTATLLSYGTVMAVSPLAAATARVVPPRTMLAGSDGVTAVTLAGVAVEVRL